MLKPILTSAEVNALPEALRKEYVEKDGQFVIDVEGILLPGEALKLKSQVAEFRDNNRELHAKVQKLEPLAAKFEGVDPDEYRQLKSEVGELKKKGVNDPKDVDALVRSAVEKAINPLKEELTAERTKREEAQKAADKGKFRELVSAAATKAGVDGPQLRHVLRDAEETFELKDGDLVPRNGVKHPTDPLKELTPSDWLAGLSKSDPYLFAASSGGGAERGAGSNGAPPKVGVKRLMNPSPEEMGQHMDDIASGKTIVVRQ
jgi:hypothetical protein